MSFCQKLCCFCCLKKHEIIKGEKLEDAKKEDLIEPTEIKEEKIIPLNKEYDPPSSDKNEREIKGNENNEEKLTEKNEEKLIEKNEEKLIIEKKEGKLYETILKNYLNPLIDNKDVFKRTWYRDGEYELMEYSKRSIIALHDYIFDDSTKLFREFYNKDNLILSINESGSMFAKNPIIRLYFKIEKNKLPPNTSLQDLLEYTNYTTLRTIWDDQLKIYKVIEGDETEKCIIQNWMKSPVFFMSERDIIDKKYDFYENGILYSFESSVNDNYIEIPKGVTRITDLIFMNSYTENDNEFIIRNINQVNYKMNSPNSLLCVTVSGKVPNWYKKCIDVMNKDYQNGKYTFGKKIACVKNNSEQNDKIIEDKNKINALAEDNDDDEKE